MKIIGEGLDGYIVTMSGSEVMDLTGIAWSDRLEIKAGKTFDITEATSRLKQIRWKRDELQKSASNLEALASLLKSEDIRLEEATEEAETA